MATWVIGDIHGCYDDFMLMLSNEAIQFDDTIILIGDIIDRGPKSYETIQWAMENITDNGKYQMICGNHEDNIIRDFNRCQHRINKRWCSPKIRTVDDMDIADMNSDYDFDVYMYTAGFETVGSVKHIVDWFKSLPLYKDITVISPTGATQRYIIAHAWYGPRMSRDQIVWSRDIDDITNKPINDYKQKDNEILIHGHTPTLLIQRGEDTSSDVFFRKTSINIDCGCVFREYGGKLAAIRLEDQKVIYV